MNARDEAINDAITRGIENTDPLWLEMYFTLSEILLKRQLYVAGDDIKAFCEARGLWKPDVAQRWTGAPRLLLKKNWLEPLVYIKPCQPHNHMPEVQYYKSNLYDLSQWRLKT